MYTLSTLSAAYARRLDGCDAGQCKSVLKKFGLAAVSVIILGKQLTAVELEEYLRLFHQHFTGLKATRKWNIPGTTYFQGTQAKKELERRLRLRVRKCRRANNDDDSESVLFRLAKSDLPEDDIVDNLLMLWAAGFEPVRITLAWILAFLGTHPEVKQLVQQEVEALATRFCADKWDSSSSDAIWEAVRSMKYTECVLYETLRMRPPATHVSFGINPRLSSYRVGEAVVPAGWRIICGWTGTFNDPRVFEAAESFRPERFEHDPSPLGFTPFGGGIRRCPGRFFVKYEILLFLFVLFQHHRPHIQATTTPTMDKPNVSPRDLLITLGP
ncbi:unnamed protein product [Adineta ricciae]|nr:unnamed protein product [Adineta ricciae]